jgi:hypothetical protein
MRFKGGSYVDHSYTGTGHQWHHRHMSHMERWQPPQ